MSHRGRPKPGEIHFGNESFLDVIANIVGILIILIVVAGLRVRNAPAVAKVDPAVEAELTGLRQQWQADKARIETDNAQRQTEYDRALEARLAEIQRRKTKESDSAKQRSQAVAKRKEEISAREARARVYRAEAAELANEIAALTRELADAQAGAGDRKTKQTQLQAAVAKQTAAVEQLKPLVADEARQVEAEKADGEQLAAQLDALRAELDEMRRKPLPTVEWKHFAAPVARKVTSKEIHFRCLQGRVADVHLQELLDRIVNRVASRAINKSPAMEGTVGPIGGFRMRYELMNVESSMVEQLHDPFAGKIDLRGFEIAAESDDVGEAADAALQSGSKFLGSLIGKPPRDYAVTLWVYPDSFDMVQPIQMYLHQRGYTVALRPMLTGIPISGSPFGSASQGY